MDYEKARKKLGLKHKDVAMKLGISLPTWQNIREGITKKPSPETQKKLDKLFGKDVADDKR